VVGNVVEVSFFIFVVVSAVDGTSEKYGVI
jgi:hypothetical protein